MMTALTDFIVDLRSQAQVVSFCTSNHVYPLKAPSGIENCIVYNQLYDIRPSYYTGSFGLTEMLLELNIYSKSYSDLDNLVIFIIGRYHGFNGTLGNTNFGRIIIHNNNTLLQSVDDNIYRYVFEIEFTY